MAKRLILASASPRRRQILAELGVVFDVVPSDISEQFHPGETAHQLAERLAREKALSVAQRHPHAWVLGADTVVVIDDEILGKPGDAARARVMLEKLSGRTHRVLTGFALAGPPGELRHSEVVASAVTFRALSGEEIEEYVCGGEPLDKAGAYAIQGGARRFVESVEGSHSNVVGLPVAEVAVVLERFGLAVAGRRTASVP